MTTGFRRSPLALAVLGLLEDGPLHPYGIQRLVKDWGKDQVINVGDRSSLYRMISRLGDAGLITAHGSSRDQHYPERTSYELTDAGRAATRQWMAEILSAPRNEFPEFPAALSFLPILTPQETEKLLTARRERLVQQLAEREVAIATELAGFQLPRVTMLETEYLRALTQAELAWIDGTLAGIRDGTIDWNRDELRAAAARWDDHTAKR
ncbi:Transcriptional regulator PadR-like family protein [Frankia sp. AiPs1]|uniref:PadR family transcriptional regulator n=1 Tax=Frankia sp. AiPa1 TaxID=573492 RepID=UPI00202B756E|nr:PadR family transcriptional regulator [Frankia sp. AiPa1]MCL9759289.1 PadR family transcriptional regulator [Frankia sp. AiPa1]